MNRRLRVCLDARKCGDGGIGVYIRNAIFGLVHQPVDITLLTNDRTSLKNRLDSIPRSLWGDYDRSQLHIIEVKAKPFTLQELFTLRREVEWSEFDIFHTPNYVLPFGISCPTVITIHDLIHLRLPERAFYPLIAGPLLLSSLLRTKRAICVSNSTAAEVAKFCCSVRHLTRKLTVIPNALCPTFTRKEVQPAESLRSKFNLSESYFLSVLSTVKPHKGLTDLLESFRLLEKKADKTKKKKLQLVLVGQGTENIVKVEKLLQSTDCLKNVRLLGSVSQEELYQLYAHAQALIVPSFEEGFCLPVIEAQALQTPVITRPIPAVLENVSPRDVVCTDFTVKSLKEGINRFLEKTASKEQNEALLEAWQEGFSRRVDPHQIGSLLLQVYQQTAGFREGVHDREHRSLTEFTGDDGSSTKKVA
ncbi:MAG: glycosyltransferase family 4 protein [Bdellovibrionales bacterium]|nr:glycosyltransferase family 4 protein [Bdellovibrionales bacterium]